MLLVYSLEVCWLKISGDIGTSLMNFRLLHLNLLWWSLLLNIFFFKHFFFILVLIRYSTFFSTRSRCYSWLTTRIRFLCLKITWRETTLINLSLSLSIELGNNCHVVDDLLLCILINWVSNIDISLHHKLLFFVRLNHLRPKRLKWLLIGRGLVVCVIRRRWVCGLLVCFVS